MGVKIIQRNKFISDPVKYALRAVFKSIASVKMSVDACLYPVLAQQMCESRSLLFIVGRRKMKRADNLVGLEFFFLLLRDISSLRSSLLYSLSSSAVKSFASGAYPSPAAAYGYLFSAGAFNKRRIILEEDHLLVSVELVQFSGRGPPQIMISFEQKFSSRQRPLSTQNQRRLPQALRPHEMSPHMMTVSSSLTDSTQLSLRR